MDAQSPGEKLCWLDRPMFFLLCLPFFRASASRSSVSGRSFHVRKNSIAQPLSRFSKWAMILPSRAFIVGFFFPRRRSLARLITRVTNTEAFKGLNLYYFGLMHSCADAGKAQQCPMIRGNARTSSSLDCGRPFIDFCSSSFVLRPSKLLISRPLASGARGVDFEYVSGFHVQINSITQPRRQ